MYSEMENMQEMNRLTKDLFTCQIHVHTKRLILVNWWFDVKVFDGAVHLLSPTAAVRTFEDYANDIFIPYIVKQLCSSTRVDLVWDRYVKGSLKTLPERKEGKESEEKLQVKIKFQDSGKTFCVMQTTNKNCSPTWQKRLLAITFNQSTYGEGVLVSGSNLAMPACNHEEAVTTLVLHVQNALQRGCVSCFIRTVDTDVVVILIGKFYHLQ